MIKLEKIKKSYTKGILVLKDISLELPDTGLITFLGESGSGKSTLLNIIGGLDKATFGSITYDGEVINNIDEYRNKNITYIFQDYFLLPNLTVYDNLKLYLEEVGVYSLEEINTRINEVLRIVKLHKYKKHLAKNLSGGEQQRVAMARALLRKSKIILADEPTGNLDITNARLIMDVLEAVAKTSLVVLVTHNKTIAEEYSNHIYEIGKGVIKNDYIPVVEDKEDIKEETIDLNKISVSELNDKLGIELSIVNGEVVVKKKEKKQQKVVKKDRVKKEIILPNYDDTKEYGKKSKLHEAIQFLFDGSKTSKINRIILGVIGVILFMCSYFLIAISTINPDEVRYASNAYVVNKNIPYSDEDTYASNNEFYELISNGDVSNIVEYKVLDFSLFKNNYVLGSTEKAVFMPISYNSSEILYGVGSTTAADEIIISKKLADSIRGNIPLDMLINYIVTTSTNERYCIVGICNSNSYEAFYYKKDLYKANKTQKITIDVYGSFIAYLVDDYSNITVTLAKGTLPDSSRKILVEDDGKIEVGDKFGIYIVAGTYYKPSDDVDYCCIMNVASAEYIDNVKMADKMYNKKKKIEYVFKYNGVQNYDNITTCQNYSNLAFNGEMHDQLVTFVVPSITAFVLCVGYFIVMGFVVAKNKTGIIAFKRVIGKKKSKVLGNVSLSALIEGLIFVLIPYIFSSLLLLLFKAICSSFKLGISVFNPYATLWFYVVGFGAVLAYGICLLLTYATMIVQTPAGLMKNIKK